MPNIFSSVKKQDQKFGPPHAVLNLSKVGLRYFRIGIKASETSKEKLVSKLVAHPNVGWIFYAEGYFNLAIGIWAKDNAEINDISQKIRTILSPTDEIVFQSELTSLYSFGNRPLTGEVRPMPIVDATLSPVALSSLEIDYIKLLALDSSLPQGELARILNIDEKHLGEVHQKLLGSGVIAGYQERVDYGGVYFKVFVDTLSHKKPTAEEELIQSLWKDKHCIYFERANSKYDLEFELILQNESEIKDYLNDFSDFQVAILTKNVYTNLYPVNKVANLKEIRDTLLRQDGEMIDFRNSKLWYLNYAGAEAYLDIYTGNKDYLETMEKGELDLFSEIAGYLKAEDAQSNFSLIDLGSGDGQKGRAFAEKIGEDRIKAYYPVDIQPIELAAALGAHAETGYAKHPTLLDFENLSARFPLKVHPHEKQLYIFLGGTYGNFPSEQINAYLKPILHDSSRIFVAMPIVAASKTDAEIMNSYASEMIDNVAFGPLSQVGFKREDFEINPRHRDLIVHIDMEGRRLVTSLVLKKQVTVFDKVFEKGTVFKFTTSWKPTLEEFIEALEKDFKIEKVFQNKDMAIACLAVSG